MCYAMFPTFQLNAMLYCCRTALLGLAVLHLPQLLLLHSS
jgi:hypothetical protein